MERLNKEKEIFTFDDKKKLTKEEIVYFLQTQNEAVIDRLFTEADRIRKKYAGNEVHIRGIIEFSNHCGKDCLYCGLRKSNSFVARYRMSLEEIFISARAAAELGYKTVVLQSGEDRFYTISDMCSLVERIKGELDLAVTLSLGELSYDEYARLKDAGTDRYLLRFETSDPKLYKKLKPDGDYGRRFIILKQLRELGFQVGSGIMLGLPGQTLESIADDILLFDELQLDMVGNGPFISHADTPLKDTRGGDLTTSLKVAALTRLVTLNAHIPATSALGAIHPEGRQKAFGTGANVIMPNITPKKYRKHYQIYPGKICIDESPRDCSNCISHMLKTLGRTISKGYGHSLR